MFPAGGIPYLHRFILRGRGDTPAIGRPGGASDLPTMAAIGIWQRFVHFWAICPAYASFASQIAYADFSSSKEGLVTASVTPVLVSRLIPHFQLQSLAYSLASLRMVAINCSNPH